VLICAPAGYGKTVLLANWARSGPWPPAWLSPDAGDNDPARFWRHAVAALDRVRPGIGGRVGALLGPPAPASFEGLVSVLINELATQGRIGSVIEIGALRALALAASGQEAGAVAALAGALTLPCPRGYVRVFADEAAPMAALLGRLVAASGPAWPRQRFRSAAWPGSSARSTPGPQRWIPGLAARRCQASSSR
jgi:hypothetical protein